jgi:septal ring factor EnvC (AmiA/AmiB activator)
MVKTLSTSIAVLLFALFVTVSTPVFCAAQGRKDPDIEKLKRMLPKLEQLVQEKLPMLKQMLEAKLQSLQPKMENLGPKFDRLEQRLRNIEQRLDRLEQKQLFGGSGGGYGSRPY